MTTKSPPRLLLGVALLGASSLSLSAGGVQAVEVCTFNSTAVPPVVCTNPVPPAKVKDKTLTVVNGPTVGEGKVDFDFYLTAGKENFQVDTDFNPGPLVGAAGGTTGTFSYNLKIDDSSPHIFERAALAWAGVSSGFGAPSVTKEIFKTSSFLPADLITTLTVNGSSTADILGYRDIWVKDTYTVPEGAQLDSFQNTFTQVPGPLPLLGVGTAFGFSRRLRRRAKARVSLG